MSTDVLLVNRKVREVFLSIRKRVLDKYDYLPHTKVAYCFQADMEHDKSARQYAHWGHRKNTICLAHDIDKLPEANLRGIFLHEYGHVLDDHFEPEEGTDEEDMADKLDDIADGEDRADEIVSVLLGVDIEYDDNDVQREVTK